jgi:glycosyltransferase involved in cell wall biosynthesis
MNIFINASNIHIGGGKVILNDLIRGTKYFEFINFIFYVDSRFEIQNLAQSNVIFKIVKKRQRILVYSFINNEAQNNDIVIYLTTLPPIFKHKCKTILVQSNRFVIDNYTLSGFSIKTKLRINAERLLFWINKNNADYIIVQSESMSYVLSDKRIPKNKVKVIAYKHKEDDIKRLNSNNHHKASNVFLYISSDDPHKNHEILIESWCLLSEEGIFPKLILTIDKTSNLYELIVSSINKFKLDIEIKSNLKRNEIIDLFNHSTALIYPSLFESYGLPLVEANQYKLPVLASELDYVRDILDPVETFDPNSAKSISRSVKRFLKIKDDKTNIVAPEHFIESVINL